MFVQLDRGGGSPLYRQITDQIKSQISDGRLPAGARLPTVRQLSKQLGVTRLTVHSAYSELQMEGWLEATVGRGTFVAPTAQPRRLAAVVGRRVSPDGVLEDMQRITRAVGLRSFAYADPDPALFPLDEFHAMLSGARDELATLFQYGSPQGDAALRIELVELLRERGIQAMPGEILVTAGVTQGLALVAQALAKPCDVVAVEQPTYLGILHTLKSHGLQPIGVPLDEEGPRLDVLEQVIAQHRPRFFYTIPSFHNPTGICMPEQRRRDLLAMAARHQLFIVEDDIYGRLSFDGPAPPTLKALDQDNCVIYLDGFSKVLMPGLRTGYVVAPAALQERLPSLRRAADLCGVPLIQNVLAGFLHRGLLKQHLRRALPVYRERRDTLVQALRHSMPEGVKFTTPRGGFCCWLTLPDGEAAADVYYVALEHGLAFTPGEVFLASPGPGTHLRICFASQSPLVIRDGIALLGELIQSRLNRTATARYRYAPLV